MGPENNLHETTSSSTTTTTFCNFFNLVFSKSKIKRNIFSSKFFDFWKSSFSTIFPFQDFRKLFFLSFIFVNLQTIVRNFFSAFSSRNFSTSIGCKFYKKFSKQVVLKMRCKHSDRLAGVVAQLVDTRGPWFESSHRQISNIYALSTVLKRQKINRKRPGMTQIFKHSVFVIYHSRVAKKPIF